MSNRFHNKLHKHNHHSKPTAGYPDSGYDPIASYESPFLGDFYSTGDIVTTENLSAQKNIYANNAYFHGNLTVLGDISQLDTVVNATSSVRITNSGTGPGLSVKQYGNQPIANFLVNDKSSLFIDGKTSAPGFVGINTDSPNERLTVNGTISSSGSMTVDGVVRVKTLPIGSTNTVVTKNSATNILESRQINKIVWDTNFNFLSGAGLNGGFLTKTLNSNGVTKSIIYDDGSGIGIDTTSLSGKLTVNGDTRIQGELIVGSFTNGTTNDVITKSSNGTLEYRPANPFIWNLTLNPLTGVGTANFIPKFTSSGIDDSVICQDQTTSNIGILTTSPNKTLTVNGEISSTGVVYANGGNSNTWNTVTNKLNKKTNIPVSRVGDTSYLDLDIKGDFKGSQSTDRSRSYLLQEKDGTFVGLRGGFNGVLKKVFYFTSSDAELLNTNITDIEYRPAFLLPTEYVSELIDGNYSGMLLRVTNSSGSNKFYWVKHQGTLNPAVHTLANTVDVTSVISTLNAGSLVYVPEKNIFIVTKQDGYKTQYCVLNSALVVENSGGSFWTQIDLNSSSEITYGLHNGTAHNGTPLINHTQTPNIHYYVNGDDVYISQYVSVVLFYPGAVLYVGYNSCCKYNTLAKNFGDFYPKPYFIDPSNSSTFKAPFFSKDSTNFFSWYNIGNTKFYQINDSVYEAIKEHSIRPSDFTFRKHPLLLSWSDAVVRPYDRSTTPPMPAAWSTDIKTFIPTDASLLGKTVTSVSFVSPTRLYSFSESKRFGEVGTSYKSVISQLPNSNNTATYNMFGGGTASGLNAPTTIFECPAAFKPLHNGNHAKNNSEDEYFSSVVYSNGNLRLKKFDPNNIRFDEINGDTFTSITLDTLPSNYVNLIDAILDLDSVTSGEDSTKRRWSIYHLRNDLYLVSFGCFFSGVGIKSFFKLLTHTGGVFNSVSSSYLAGTIAQIDGVSMTLQGVPRQYMMSSGSYDNGVDTIYIIFKCVGAEAPGTNRQFGVVAQINYSSNSIINWRAMHNITNQNYSGVPDTVWPTWHSPAFGIHPTYGPYMTNNLVDEFSKSVLYFIDKTSDAVLSSRIVDCFSTLLGGASIQTNYLVPLTIKPATGFVLYVSSTPVFIKGDYYTLPTQSIDLVSVVGGGVAANVQNRTFYVYVELVGSSVQLSFLTTRLADTDSMIYIGTVVTNLIGIQNSSFSKVSRLGNLQIEDKITISGTTTATNEFIKVIVNGQTKYLRLFDI